MIGETRAKPALKDALHHARWLLVVCGDVPDGELYARLDSGLSRIVDGIEEALRAIDAGRA